MTSKLDQFDSPIAPLLKLVAASPYALAPERAAELDAVRREKGITLWFDDGLGPADSFSVDTRESRIHVSIRGLERLWAGCHAYWLITLRAEQALGRGLSIDLQRDPELLPAMRLLEWGEKQAAPWPLDLPRPTVSPGSGAYAATEFFLCACGWSLLHEIGHVVLEHQGVPPFPDDARQQELAADRWASEWVLGRWQDYGGKDERVFGKRVGGIVLALSHIGHLEVYERRAGGTTHPDPPDRLIAFYDEYLGPDHELVAAADVDRYLAVVAFKLHFDRAGLQIADRGYEGLDDLLREIMIVLKRHRTDR